MKMHMDVVYTGGSAIGVDTSMADLVAFEREFDRSVASFSADFRLTDVCWLSWHALKRLGSTVLDFDHWVDTVDAVTAGAAEEPAPLETAAPASS